MGETAYLIAKIEMVPGLVMPAMTEVGIVFGKPPAVRDCLCITLLMVTAVDRNEAKWQLLDQVKRCTGPVWQEILLKLLQQLREEGESALG